MGVVKVKGMRKSSDASTEIRSELQNTMTRIDPWLFNIKFFWKNPKQANDTGTRGVGKNGSIVLNE